MPANDLSLSMHNPILIYSFLALYGLLTVLMLTYVHTKFRTATKTLKLLETEWQSADSRHAGFVGVAQDRLSKLAAAPPVPALPLRHTAVNGDKARPAGSGHSCLSANFRRTLVSMNLLLAKRLQMSGCECKPDAKRKRDSAQPEHRAQPSKEVRLIYG